MVYCGGGFGRVPSVVRHIRNEPGERWDVGKDRVYWKFAPLAPEFLPGYPIRPGVTTTEFEQSLVVYSRTMRSHLIVE